MLQSFDSEQWVAGVGDEEGREKSFGGTLFGVGGILTQGLAI
jgi:hypothetical protein